MAPFQPPERGPETSLRHDLLHYRGLPLAFDFRIFDLQELHCLEIVATFSILARFQTLDQNCLHRGDKGVNVDVCDADASAQ